MGQTYKGEYVASFAVVTTRKREDNSKIKEAKFWINQADKKIPFKIMLII